MVGELNLETAKLIGGDCTCCGRQAGGTGGCLHCQHRTYDGNGALVECSCGRKGGGQLTFKAVRQEG